MNDTKSHGYMLASSESSCFFPYKKTALIEKILMNVEDKQVNPKKKKKNHTDLCI